MSGEHWSVVYYEADSGEVVVENEMRVSERKSLHVSCEQLTY
jgi:hypothetical protein